MTPCERDGSRHRFRSREGPPRGGPFHLNDTVISKNRSAKPAGRSSHLPRSGSARFERSPLRAPRAAAPCSDAAFSEKSRTPLPVAASDGRGNVCALMRRPRRQDRANMFPEILRRARWGDLRVRASTRRASSPSRLIGGLADQTPWGRSLLSLLAVALAEQRPYCLY
jgi:hypothetical protein